MATPITVSAHEDLLRECARRQVKEIAVALCDLSGQLRGKWVAPEKFAAALAGGLPFPPIFPVTDFADAVLPVRAGAALERLGDGHARAVPESWRMLPWRDDAAGALCFAEMTGPEAALDPRALYGRIAARAVAAGLVPWQAVEYEFTLLDTPGSALAARRYRDLAPPDSQSALYGLWRPLAGGEFWHGLRAALAVAGIPVEAMHGEFGAGCHEVIVEPAAGVMAADHAVLLRAIVKAHAARHGLTATFMARWSGAAPGHSGHVHFSLRDPAGRPLLEPGAQPGEWHAPARHVIGGLQRWLPEMALLLLPNVNSFRRLSASAWSFDPRWCLWGEDNRTTALRLLRGAPGQAHIEVRIPGADANPYLALGAVLGAAWRGMEERAEPTAPITGNAFRSNRSWPEHLRLPQTFTEAIDRFAASALVTELFGGEFQRVFAETRRAQEHESRDAVSEWELRRFLE